jgi:ADP-heptose:LPS heptosyltransferase
LPLSKKQAVFYANVVVKQDGNFTNPTYNFIKIRFFGFLNLSQLKKRFTVASLKRINDIRRKIMRGLTKNIGTSHANEISGNLPDIKRILICRPNHRLGNLLLVTPLLDEITATFPESRIDLFVKGAAARDIFRNYNNVDRIIELPRKPFSKPLAYAVGWLQLKLQHYDMVINVDKKSSSGRLSTQWANARYRFFGEENPEIIPDAKHIAKSPVYNLRAGLKRLGISKIRQRIPQPDLKLSWLEVTKGKKKLRELVGNDKRTISLFTYATGEKCYSELWWANFYNKLKIRYSDYNIIEILPVENISKLNFRVPAFYSKNIREIGAVIANTDAFIGADSGIMHLSSAVDTPTIGLFSVTDEAKYEPYNDKSLAVNTKKFKLRHCFAALDKILTEKRLAYPEYGNSQRRQHQFG